MMDMVRVKSVLLGCLLVQVVCAQSTPQNLAATVPAKNSAQTKTEAEPLVPEYSAFTFENYQLTVQASAEQSEIAVRGHVTLRNDAEKPRSNVTMQLSSSLRWLSIKAAGEFVFPNSVEKKTGADHTGAVNEVTIHLQHAVEPGSTVEIEFGYRGQIKQSGTRLTDVGAPEKVAMASEWDRITPDFTGLRGAGNVIWYPVSIEPVVLGDGNKIFSRLSAWRVRNALSKMQVDWSWKDERPPASLLSNGVVTTNNDEKKEQHSTYSVLWPQMSVAGPVIIAGEYDALPCAAGKVYSLLSSSSRGSASSFYVESCTAIAPRVEIWTGHTPAGAQFIELPESGDSAFDAGATFLAPMRSLDKSATELQVAHTLSHAALASFRPWIDEGLAHYIQTRMREQQAGRKSAIAYLEQRHGALALAEEMEPGSLGLINATSDIAFRTKAQYVWWMLRDLVGDAQLAKALGNYSQTRDKDASWMQQLLQTESHKDLEWFFDDWVYRDHSLPDLKITEVVPRSGLNGGWLTAITVENTGGATADVELVVKLPSGDQPQHIRIAAHDKTIIRVPTEQRPLEVRVNDGSVPESDASGNSFVVPPKEQ